MKSMLEQIFFGTKGNNEQIPDTERYYKLSNEAYGKIDDFIKKLSKEKAQEFNEIIDMQAEVQSEISFAHYKEGFKIGLLLGIEMCQEEENQ